MGAGGELQRRGRRACVCSGCTGGHVWWTRNHQEGMCGGHETIRRAYVVDTKPSSVVGRGVWEGGREGGGSAAGDGARVKMEQGLRWSKG